MKRTIPAVFVALLLTFILGSCNSHSPIAEQPEVVHKAADLTISLKYVDRETLIERHMSNHKRWQNPYIDFPGQIPRRRVIVYEATFETTDSTVSFHLFEQFLAIASSTGRAQTEAYMMNIWSPYTDDVGSNLMKHALKTTILPKTFTVAPGEPVSGYLVFADNFPKEGGRGMLTLSATTPDGDRGTFEIPVDFLGTDGSSASAAGDNTGVFAE